MAPGMMIVHSNPISIWDLENGFSTMSNERKFPFRMVSASVDAGIEIFLRANSSKVDTRCNGQRYGFKMSVTMPGEALRISRNPLQIPIEKDIQIAIKPKWITTSDGLRKYEPHQRQCFFQSERRLRFLKMYTQANCEEECLANFTLNECGCVKFSMPSKFWFIF